jgi:hypothetical protein
VREHLYFYRVVNVVSVYDADSLRVIVSLGRKLKDEWPLSSTLHVMPHSKVSLPSGRVKARGFL